MLVSCLDSFGEVTTLFIHLSIENTSNNTFHSRCPPKCSVDQVSLPSLSSWHDLPALTLVLYKQTAYGFYRPAAIAIANMLSDVPFSASRLLLFNVIIYFMCNLHRSVGAFFTFHLFQTVTLMSMQAFFRFFGVLCTSFDVAFRLATFFIPNFISYAGQWLTAL